MDKLFSWVYNLSNISASSNTQVNGQEATRDETSPTHLENMDQAQPPIESQDVNMQSTGPTDNCINLISSDEEDNVIDLTIDDDVAPASRHYPLTTNYVPPSRRYNLSDRNPVFSRRHTLIDDYPLPPRRHTSIDDMFEISGRRNLRRHVRSLGASPRIRDPRNISRPLKINRQREQDEFQKSKEMTKRYWRFETAAKAIAGRCFDCQYKYTGNDPIMSQMAKNGLCRGCYSLHRLALQEGDKMQDVFHWLKTGELTVDVWKNQVDNAKEEQLVKRRAAAMHSRMIKLRNHANQGLATGLPTSDALYDLYINSECKCAVTGWTCHFSKFTEQKYWSVTFDHIVPVSQAQGMNPWSIANIQVMCHILNNVKGDYPDEELRRWFGLWKDART